MLQTPTTKHWLMLAYLVAFWGFAFYLIAVAVEVFVPVALVWVRLSLGAAVLLGVLFWRGGKLPRGWPWWRRMVVLAVTGNLLPFTLISWAEQSVPSSEVGLLMALMPITTLLLAHRLLEHERLTPARLIGVILGFAGVALLMGRSFIDVTSTERLPGQLAAVGATLCYAFNGVYAKRLPAFDTVSIAAGSLLAGAVLFALPALWLQPAWPLTGHGNALWAMLVLGVMATGVATWIYFAVVTDCGPGFLSTINYLIPAVAFVAGVVLLGEPAGIVQLSALCMILTGVWLIQHRRRAAIVAETNS
jgi:drug/metabolite transporter (DMT)-like permease